MYLSTIHPKAEVFGVSCLNSLRYEGLSGNHCTQGSFICQKTKVDIFTRITWYSPKT